MVLFKVLPNVIKIQLVKVSYSINTKLLTLHINFLEC